MNSQLPSYQAIVIAANSDRMLFEELMLQCGLKLTHVDVDPLNRNVRNEAVAAVASCINEDVSNSKVSDYSHALRKLAERAGYIVEYIDQDEKMFDDDQEINQNDHEPEMMGQNDHEPEMGLNDHDFDDTNNQNNTPQDATESEIANIPIGPDLAKQIVAMMDREESNTLQPELD